MGGKKKKQCACVFHLGIPCRKMLHLGYSREKKREEVEMQFFASVSFLTSVLLEGSMTLGHNRFSRRFERMFPAES